MSSRSHPCLILHVIESFVVTPSLPHWLFGKYQISWHARRLGKEKKIVRTAVSIRVLWTWSFARHRHRKIRFRFIVGNNGVV